MGHRFDPKHVAKLDNPERRKLLPPEDILNRLDVQPHHAVADVGCGPGYFTIPLARMTRGRVYGIDVSSDMLALLANRAAEAGLTHIEQVQAPAEHIPLPDASVDRILCSLVLHEVDDLDQTLAEFRRLLKPGGRVMVIEWEKKPMEAGPPMHERIEAVELETKVQAAGFQTDIWRPNPQHYIVLAQ
ncbi:MAG: methyltransferase domain-containing protein [Alicyclobacillus macrosporangiidus]|uniref:class I SAM-dependent methyltransferase n=1 Tax=Alicyclobacillus macrosporangiidus TaxID=392015 RepID=UPI0026EA0306|nr:class I SAM-dependent methyltransferase [Alicyclobacillus macrosporangiidus]MCL6600366.1 methyltransferase domain-containing protein [Alicyclobacillus macrosporangiidus]